MTFDEALLELGLTSATDAQGARRAYLKLIKVRKPESDAEGFKRVRQAYERVSAQLEQPQSFAAPAPASSTTSAPLPVVAPVPAAPGSASNSLDAFRAEFAVLPPGASVEAALGIARRALAALPAEEEALSWLVHALLAADRQDEAIETLRQAIPRFPGALWNLATRFPASITDADVDALGVSAPPGLLWRLVEIYYQLDRGERAAQLTLLAFDAQKRTPDQPPPPPNWLGALVLKLHEAGAPNAARKVSARYLVWLREEELLDAFRKEGVGQLWPLVEEFGRLPDDLPRLVRAPLARALLDGSPDLAVTFAEFARHDPPAALAARDALWSLAPELTRHFLAAVRALGPDPKGRRGAAGPAPRKGLAYHLKAAALIGTLSILIVVSCGPLSRELDRLEKVEWGSRSAALVAQVTAACADAPRSGAKVCQLARTAAEGIDGDGCTPDMTTRYLAAIDAQTALPPATVEDWQFKQSIDAAIAEIGRVRASVCKVFP